MPSIVRWVGPRGILDTVPPPCRQWRSRMYALLLLCLSADEITFADRTLDSWVEQLRSHDVDERNEALRTFQQLGGEARSALPTLCKLLHDAAAPTRLAALHALGFIGKEAGAAVG